MVSEANRLGRECPVSTSCTGEFLELAVAAGVVWGVGCPAFPDDGEPGAGEDSNGVWVAVAAVAGLLVEVGGPGVGVTAVGGEIADRVT